MAAVALACMIFGPVALKMDLDNQAEAAMSYSMVLNTVYQTTRGQEQHLNLVNLTFDDSYPTGGELLGPADLGTTYPPLFVFGVRDCAGYVFDWDRANQKLKVYYSDDNDSSDGPLIEVPNTTDLSTLSPIVLVIGW